MSPEEQRAFILYSIRSALYDLRYQQGDEGSLCIYYGMALGRITLAGGLGLVDWNESNRLVEMNTNAASYARKARAAAQEANHAA